jgi:hypothetical protein
VNADALSRNPVVIIVMITSKEYQQKILKEMHECPIGGHQGVQRTYDRKTNLQVPLQETDTQYQHWDKLLDCGTLTYV